MNHLEKIEILEKIASDALMYEYGTKSQIDAKNLFYHISGVWFKINWKEEKYDFLLNATTYEGIIYAFSVIREVIKS